MTAEVWIALLGAFGLATILPELLRWVANKVNSGNLTRRQESQAEITETLQRVWVQQIESAQSQIKQYQDELSKQRLEFDRLQLAHQKQITEFETIIRDLKRLISGYEVKIIELGGDPNEIRRRLGLNGDDTSDDR